MAGAARSFMLAGTLGLASGAAHCAEWALTPSLYFNADHQSNRVLREGTPESQALGASLDLELARRTESTGFSLAPHYYARRITPKVEADVDDLRIPMQLLLGFERGQLQLGALYADESTLTTELAETGAVRADSARLMRGTNAGWRFDQSDALQLLVSASFQDVNYTGDQDRVLNDYRYGEASVGEKFLVSARSAWTLSGFASRMRSPQYGAGVSDSSEAGVSAGLDFSWSENTRMSATLGFSRRDFDGDHSTGRTGNFHLEHTGESRRWNVDLDHGLVPFGTGVLTERDSAEFGLTQDFSTRLHAIARLSFARNEEVVSGSDVDARTYRYAELEWRWMCTESWSVGAMGGYADAQDPGAPQRVGGWTLALRTYWTPAHTVLGH